MTPKQLKIDYGYYNRYESWSKTDFYCPACGKQAVWVKDYDGRFGHPADRLNACSECTAMFTITGGVERGCSEYSKQVAEQLNKDLP